jgi:hypothetical protein
MATSATPLSAANNAKASTSAKKSNELAGGGILIGILAFAAVAAGIYVAVDEDDDAPNSN